MSSASTQNSSSLRRGRSAAGKVFLRSPLGVSIPSRIPRGFADELISENAFRISSAAVDRVYRGEMTVEEQANYIAALYHPALSTDDPLTPIDDDDEDNDVAISEVLLAEAAITAKAKAPAIIIDDDDDEYLALVDELEDQLEEDQLEEDQLEEDQLEEDELAEEDDVAGQDDVAEEDVAVEDVAEDSDEDSLFGPETFAPSPRFQVQERTPEIDELESDFSPLRIRPRALFPGSPLSLHTSLRKQESPTHSEISVDSELARLVSSPSPPSTPRLVPDTSFDDDTSMEVDELSPSSYLPTVIPTLDTPFVLKTPARSETSVDLQRVMSTPPSPTVSMFDVAGRSGPSPLLDPRIYRRPGRLITYSKADRKRYGIVPNPFLALPAVDDDVLSSDGDISDVNSEGGADDDSNVSTSASVIGTDVDMDDVDDSDVEEHDGDLLVRRSSRLEYRRTQADVLACPRYSLYSLHPTFPLPRPIVDSQDTVMGAVGPGPRKLFLWWGAVIIEGYRHSNQFYRDAGMAVRDREKAFVCWGLTYIGGLQTIVHPEQVRWPLKRMLSWRAFQEMSEFQNHFYRQMATDSFGYASSQGDHLRRLGMPSASFRHSVFTTSILEFDRDPNAATSTEDAAIGTMEAITPLGVWDPTTSGALLLPNDAAVIEVSPGDTVLVPGGKPFTFAAVAPGERQFLFRQYCSEGIFRWLSKGGLTDAEFTKASTKQEVRDWEDARRSFGNNAVKLFSKRRDIFTL
ncbi:hypothetical protein R3P38DRAFT_3616917 [Favolaschia claudopus]|uniref:Uncharacterized protein n=1 Tax=Favolaschia claudopus TaxID=2862362 RepID=A0AAW0A266_9AGAR